MKNVIDTPTYRSCNKWTFTNKDGVVSQQHRKCKYLWVLSGDSPTNRNRNWNHLQQCFPTCGTRTTSGTRRSSRWCASNFHFFTKTWIHSFLVYVSGFVSKENKSSCSLLFLLYRNIMTFETLLGNFTLCIGQLLEGKQ